MKKITVILALLAVACEPKEQPTQTVKEALEIGTVQPPKISKADSLCAERYHVFNGQTYRKIGQADFFYIFKIEDYKDSVVRVRYQVAPEFIECERCQKEIEITDTIEMDRQTVLERQGQGYKYTEAFHRHILTGH